ncbi:MAG: SIR2 family protein [bacterium]
MVENKKEKIVYLLGAGATNAEIALQKDLSGEHERQKYGLLVTNVSRRVVKKASRSPKYVKDIKMVSSTTGSLNIELLISLLENVNTIINSNYKTEYLRRLVKQDISGLLTEDLLNQFYLHKALLELHKRTEDKESLLGIISLNYDSVIDEAYREILQREPNYCFSSEEWKNIKDIPLLKLHGSFNWKDVSICGRKRNIEIIPLGINKNYLQIPYNFIWGRALEILADCTILRVIGCSLGQNDVALIDLLFKAHLEKGEAFEFQIINSKRTYDQIKGNYGFFPKIKDLNKIEDHLVPDAIETNEEGNAFEAWLKAKGMKMLKDKIRKTKYLKKVCNL